MVGNSHELIQRENGVQVPAQFPVIVSASRSTDIPGFYSDWFLHRLKIGYSAWTNPFNGVKSYVSYRDTRLIVFWSKNPESLLKQGGLLDYLEEKGINTYIQYTLNDYVAEGLEKGVPSVERRIDTFKRLVDRLGVGKVIWRFDPLILTDTISVDDLLLKAESIGNALKGYSEKMVFSFADIAAYRKVRANLITNNIRYREFEEQDMLQFAAGIQLLNQTWGYTLATCGEKIDIDAYGIVHNKCIDDDLMIKYFSDDARLMEAETFSTRKRLLSSTGITRTKASVSSAAASSARTSANTIPAPTSVNTVMPIVQRRLH